MSDRPFRGPQVEAMEEMDFTNIGLLADLVGAMDEFGEKTKRGVSNQSLLVCGGFGVLACVARL